MDDLPDNDAAFQEKVSAFVKPGDRAADAVSLLQQFRFKCEFLSDTQSWCHRSDPTSLSSPSRRYQIVLTTKDGRVVTTKATIGLVGP